MEYPDETIAPPKWWITFTPYGPINFDLLYDDGFAMERFMNNGRTVYMRESTIFLDEWLQKYALVQVIKKLMEDRNV